MSEHHENPAFQDEPPVDLDFEPVDEMDHDELASQYKELSKLIAWHYSPRNYEWHETVHVRLRDLWAEFRERADVDQPACPECGARDWSQNVGDPKYCRKCDWELGRHHDDLSVEINEAWEQILAGGSS